MIEEIDLFSAQDEDHNCAALPGDTPPPPSDNDFMGSQAPLELAVEPEENGAVSLDASGEAPLGDFAGTQSSLELASGEGASPLLLSRPKTQTAPPPESEPAETVAPVAEVPANNVVRRKTRHNNMPLLAENPAPPKSSVFKGGIIAIIGIAVLSVIGIIGWNSQVSAGAKVLPLVFGGAENRAIDVGYPGVSLKSLTGKPMRLQGGQELLLVSGELSGAVEDWQKLDVEVAILDRRLGEKRISAKVQVGTAFPPSQFKIISRGLAQGVSQIVNKNSKFQILLSAADFEETFVVLRDAPERLTVKVYPRP